MNYLRTYEELSLFGLFDSPEQKKLKAIIKSINNLDWKISATGDDFVLIKKKIESKQLESIQIKIGLKNNLVSLQTSIKPVYPRTKVCKELFSILRSRPLQFDYDGEMFRVTYDLSQDYIFTILRNFGLDNTTVDKITEYISHDFEGLYEHMIQMCIANNFISKQNQIDINNFFKSKLTLIYDFDTLTKISDKYTVDSSNIYKLTNKINLLNPKYIFKFQFQDSNILRRSTKHLILTEQLIKVFLLLDKGMRRIKRMFNSATFEVFLRDKAVFLNVRTSDEKALQEWEEDSELFYDYLIELEDHCQNSSIRKLEKWSNQKGAMVFDGYTFQFDFQKTIAEIEEAYRLTDSVLICKGLINDRIFKAMKMAVDLAQKAASKRQDIEYKVSIGDKAILVTLALDVKGTWQDTTRKEQSAEERDFDDIEIDED